LSLSACGHSLQGIPLSLARPSPSSHAPSPALQVIAFDRSHNKASEVRRLAEGFGLTCVKAYKMDATKAVLTPEQQAAAAAAAGATRGAGGAEGQQASSSGNGAAAAGDTNAAAGAAKGVADGSRGRRGGLSQPPGEATLRRLERIAASRRARGLEPAPSAHTAAGKEAVIQGFPPGSFDYVLCDAPCTALGLRPRCVRAWMSSTSPPSKLLQYLHRPWAPGSSQELQDPILLHRHWHLVQAGAPADAAGAGGDRCLPAKDSDGCGAAGAAGGHPRLLHMQHQPRCGWGCVLGWIARLLGAAGQAAIGRVSARAALCRPMCPVAWG
jgi:hypothetical protein